VNAITSPPHFLENVSVEKHVTSDMEHRLKSQCATQVSRPVFLAERDFYLESLWVR